MRWDTYSPDYTEVTFEQNPAWNFIVPGGWDEKELLEMYPYKAGHFKSKSKITQMEYQGSEEDVLNTKIIRTIHFYKPKTLWECLVGLKHIPRVIRFQFKEIWYSTPIWIQVFLRAMFFPVECIGLMAYMLSKLVIIVGGIIVIPFCLLLLNWKNETLSWRKNRKVRLRLLEQGKSEVKSFRQDPTTPPKNTLPVEMKDYDNKVVIS